jgi:hypothetical protein
MSIFNYFASSLKRILPARSRHSRRRPLRSRASLRLELLEGRVVPATFVPGTIQGQDGWSGGTGAISPSVDQAVDQTGSDAHFGVGAWHVSNDTSNGNYNGAFGGWVFSPGLSVAAGQPSSGAAADRFSATFYFRCASTVADGSNIEVDLGNTAGSDRMTFMAITNKADGDGGLQLRMAEPNPADPGNDFFFPTQIVATNITRGVWHRIDIQATFIDGQANDTFQVSLDGAAMTNLTPGSPNNGTSNWGTFEGYNDAHGSTYNQTNRLFFRSGAAPSAYGSFSDTGAKGFYIDDVSYKDWNSSAPGTILASYTATFEQAPSTVYVNASWAGLGAGVDPDGAGPATGIGYDAFATIQDGLNAVASGGTVYVAAGTYAEHVLVNKPVTLLGANFDVNPVTGTRGAESIVDGKSFAPFYVTASDATIDGFTIQGASSGSAFPGGYGIEMASGISGTHITNDIIQNNLAGIALANLSASDPAVIQYNLFRNNTLPGPASGNDIYADNYTAGTGGVNNVLIDSNTFTNSSFVENAWALDMSNTGTKPFSGITFSNNDVTNHGRGVCFYATTNSTITGNTIAGATHYAIGLFGNNGSPANSLFTIANNTLDAQGTGGAGVELVNDTSASAYSGTLTLSNFGLLVTDVQQEVVYAAPGIVQYGDTEVAYGNVMQVNLNNTTAVNAIAGPDTADRDTAFLGLTADERFVQALYLDNLGRAGSPTELDGWLAVLHGPGGQSAVAGGILGSFEAHDRLVNTWFQTYLGRSPASGKEEWAWVSLLQAGHSEEQVLSQLLATTDFYNHAQNLVPSGTADERYVQALYQVLLGRSGDSHQEVDQWVTALSAGMSRQQVALAFLQGPEFRAAQFEGYYNALLRRSEDPTGLANWVKSPMDMGSVRIDFEGGSEFYTNG